MEISATARPGWAGSEPFEPTELPSREPESAARCSAVMAACAHFAALT